MFASTWACVNEYSSCRESRILVSQTPRDCSSIPLENPIPIGVLVQRDPACRLYGTCDDFAYVTRCAIAYLNGAANRTIPWLTVLDMGCIRMECTKVVVLVGDARNARVAPRPGGQELRGVLCPLMYIMQVILSSSVSLKSIVKLRWSLCHLRIFFSDQSGLGLETDVETW